LEVIGDKLVPSKDTLKELSTEGLDILCEKQNRVLYTTVKKDGTSIFRYCSRSPYAVVNMGKGTTHCFDMTPNLVMTGNSDGGLFVFDTTQDVTNPKLMRNLKGHLSDIYTCRFFPSRTVVLSGGGDMVLKIWTLMQDGMCVAELKGHKTGILSSDLIERGRNIVSSSRDGTAILWDVPSQNKIYDWGDKQHAINECRIAPHTSSATASKDVRDVGTDGKLLLLASDDRKIEGYDLRQRSGVFSCKTGSPVNTVVGLSHSEHIISGEHDGTVTCWDKRNMQIPSKHINLENSTITRLLERDCRCWIGCGNGLTYDWDPLVDNMPLGSLVSDIEPITGIAYRKPDELATVSRRGILRIYSISNNS